MFGCNQSDMVAYVRYVAFRMVFTIYGADKGGDMLNIFDVFLPQLLRYPNPNDPLNGEAAALLMRHPTEYEAKVRGGKASFFAINCT
jgi:hypothetical protein